MRFRLSIGLLALCAVWAGLALSPVAAGQESAAEEKEIVDGRISALERKIAAAREKEGVLTAEIEVVTEKINALQDDVAAAEARLDQLESVLALHQRKLDRLNLLYSLQTKKLIFLQRQHKEAVERLSKRWAGRVLFGGMKESPKARTTGVVVDADTLRKIVPGRTTHEEVLRLLGSQVEELSRLTVPDQKALVYRGRRLVPSRRRALGFLATIEHWDAEDHEVTIDLERDVVRDLQVRVRRSRVSAPEGP